VPRIQATLKRSSSSAGWLPSGVPDVLIKLDGSGRIVGFHLERTLNVDDLWKVSEAAKFVRKANQTIRNWYKADPDGFPLRRMGGTQVIIRPFFEAYILHEFA
jgi:hypothetical protein